MYMNSVINLKNDVKTEIEKSINSKLKCEILAITVGQTLWPHVMAVTVIFSNDHGKAEALLKVDGDTCTLLAPFKVNFNKKEGKENA